MRSRTRPAVRALRGRCLVLGLGLLGIAGCDTPAPAADADAQVAPATGADGALYRSTVDEQPGVAVVFLVDRSGSMAESATDAEPAKEIVARRALAKAIEATGAAQAKNPDLPIKVAILAFGTDVETVLPMQVYQADSVRLALGRIPPADGRTAIGDALTAARKVLYAAGTFRKHVVVLTDGENTTGPAPGPVAREIAARSEGGVHLHIIAFDVAADVFAFVREVGGDLVAATDQASLQRALDDLYGKNILAEALDAGEVQTALQQRDTAAAQAAARVRAADSAAAREAPRRAVPKPAGHPAPTPAPAPAPGTTPSLSPDWN